MRGTVLEPVAAIVRQVDERAEKIRAAFRAETLTGLAHSESWRETGRLLKEEWKIYAPQHQWDARLEELGVSTQDASRRLRIFDHWDSLLPEMRSSGPYRCLEFLQEKAGAGRGSRRKKARADEPADVNGDRYHVEQADCLPFLAEQPPDSIDLVFGSPPYEDARLYLEGGKNLGVARDRDAWVSWMVEVYKAALVCCKGLVAFVVEGRTKNYEWSASPARLIVALQDAGVAVRKPPIYKRVGIPGSGGPDWLRNDYEFIVCATRGGPLPWDDNTAMGEAPKFGPGGEISHRTQDGRRVNRIYTDRDASQEERNNVGPHRARRKRRREAGKGYVPPERCNPGNVIDCGAVGGGNMGNGICHENEAPFPESLAKFFVLSFCPPGGLVCDPFCGSGTTLAVAVEERRRATGCDLRASQVRLTRRRLSGITATMFPSGVNDDEQNGQV
jgi:hypothetical protein